MIGAYSVHGKASVEQLIPNLDHFASSLENGGGRLGVAEELISLLAATYDNAVQRDELKEFREICQGHSLHRRVLEDPFTRRGFEKPRGYAGDAVMLDYIYRPKELQVSELGIALHRTTTSAGAAKSIRWRRSHLAARLLDGMEDKKRLRVLSVASGHLRELDIVSTATSNRNVEIVALDQDGESLEDRSAAIGNSIFGR
jgi:extracellular factor (EF) 3-hydroxypalmitic acid methyl ester biosynthesis protein